MTSQSQFELFAPNQYPKAHRELRAYTIAAFRVAQNSEQLSLISMPKPLIDFLLRDKAIDYWQKNGWLIENSDGYRLSPDGLVICQSALAEQLPSHNTNTINASFWEDQFRNNHTLPRHAQFGD